MERFGEMNVGVATNTHQSHHSLTTRIATLLVQAMAKKLVCEVTLKTTVSRIRLTRITIHRRRRQGLDHL